MAKGKTAVVTAAELERRREAKRQAQRGYRRSPAGRAAMARYNRSPAGRAAYARYTRSAKGRARSSRYNRSQKGRVRASRYGRTSDHRADPALLALARRAEGVRQDGDKVLELTVVCANLKPRLMSVR